MNYKRLLYNDPFFNKNFAFLKDTGQDLKFDDDQSEMDLSTIDIGQYLMIAISLDGDEKYLTNCIKFIYAYNPSQKDVQFVLDACEQQLLFSYNYLCSPDGDDTESYEKIISKIVLILICLLKTNIEAKIAITSTISLGIILELAILKQDYEIMKTVILLFTNLLYFNKDGDEEFVYQYFSEFCEYFPLFERLYIEKKRYDPKNILDLFIYLTQVPSFFEFFDKKNEFIGTSIINDILSKVEASNNKILTRVLTFTYITIKEDFNKCFDYINRYIELLGKGSVNGVHFIDKESLNVVLLASKIIRYIAKYEFDWIPVKDYFLIANHMIENTKNTEACNKIEFLKCLFTITQKLDYVNLCLICKNSYCSFLVEFLDVDGNDDVVLSVLKEVNMITDKEIKNKGTNDLLCEFLDNGGDDFLHEYMEYGDNDEIIQEMQAIIEKIDKEQTNNSI